MYEYELEALAELEGEFEGEFEAESELESELEAEEEAFFGTLARLARGALRSPALRRVAQTAARAALNGTPPQAEYEEESEFEEEAVLNPIRRVYPDALMEHFGHAAAEAESEAEAEALIGALVPLARRVATRALPRVARAAARAVMPRSRPTLPGAPPRPAAMRPRVTPQTAVPRARAALRRVSPQLVRGATRVARTLRRAPATRPLVRVVPAIVQQTMNRLGQQAALGRQVTAGQAMRTLARQTANVIGSPQQAAKAYQRSMTLDHRYHAGAPDMGGDPSSQSQACPVCNRSF